MRDVYAGEGEQGAHDEGVGEGEVRDFDSPPGLQLGGCAEGVGGRDGEVVDELEVGHVELELGLDGIVGGDVERRGAREVKVAGQEPSPVVCFIIMAYWWCSSRCLWVQQCRVDARGRCSGVARGY